MLTDQGSLTIRRLRAQAQGFDAGPSAVLAALSGQSTSKRPASPSATEVNSTGSAEMAKRSSAIAPQGPAAITVDVENDRSTLALIARLRAQTGRPRPGMAQASTVPSPDTRRLRAGRADLHGEPNPVDARGAMDLSGGDRAPATESWRDVLDRLLRRREQRPALHPDQGQEPAATRSAQASEGPFATDVLDTSMRQQSTRSETVRAIRSPPAPSPHVATGQIDRDPMQAEPSRTSTELLASRSRAVLSRPASSPLAGLEVSELLFLDLETSGLSVGHGPFCAGVANFDGAQLDVEQWLLAGPAAEPALLARLAERIAARPVLVSYNGASFDWPLLKARARLFGIALPALKAHYDLLPMVRRLFAKQWPQCRLVDVEQRLLGRHRVDDLPSAQVPACWRRYLASGRRALLEPVVAHNRIDLESLAQLWLELVDRQAFTDRPPVARRKGTAMAA